MTSTIITRFHAKDESEKSSDSSELIKKEDDNQDCFEEFLPMEINLHKPISI